MERSVKRNVMLEYYDKGHQFHYNMGDYNIPDENGCFLPLGWCSWEEADLFCSVVQPFITKRSIDTPVVPFDVMKESWERFCRWIEKDET